jgi:hypothetical protein
MDASKPRYSNKLIVEALYRGILSRGPDESGLSSNLEHLSSLETNAADLTKFVRSFLFSKEYLEKATRQFTQRLIASSALQDVEPTDFVSLGSHCLVSYALKEMGLKRYSCPFDWIFSKPSMVEHCIKDSFATLADRSHYEPVIDSRGTELQGLCHHAYYRNSCGINRVFNHRDMRIEENYHYLLRCIDRFTKLLASNNHKVFVLLSRESCSDDEQFVSLYDTLSRSTSNFSLLFFIVEEPQTDGYDFGMDHIKSIGASCLAAMRPISKAGPLTFDDPLDDFMFRRTIVAFGRLTRPHISTAVPGTECSRDYMPRPPEPSRRSSSSLAARIA